MYNHLRANVRDLLVAASLSEARQFIAIALERGDEEAAGYAEEFIADYAEDFADDDNWADGDDAVVPACYF